MATVQIQKSGGQPWGFRLAGGRDFNVPLQVKKVGVVAFQCQVVLLR